MFKPKVSVEGNGADEEEKHHTNKIESRKPVEAQITQQSPYTKLFEKRVDTFKIVKPGEHFRKISHCDVSLEFAKTEDDKKHYIIVVRMSKKVLIQGRLNEKVSRCKLIEEKSAKNQLKLCMQQTVEIDKFDDDKHAYYKQKKIIFPYCLINFQRSEDMLTFKSEFEKAVAELKGSDSGANERS